MANPSELSFKDDPGAVRHGNFINYYKFHGAQDRLNSIPKDIVRDHLQSLISAPSDVLFALDLGCNSGEITQGLRHLLCDLKLTDPENVRVLGVDIDPALIQRAREDNLHPTTVQYESADLMEALASSSRQLLLQFINPRSAFHLVTCLSITMWIHLNNGDEGLRNFLKHTAQISEILIVEPQRWKSYKDAVRRMKRGAGEENAFPQFKSLKWRETIEEDIHNFLESSECKMKLVYKSSPSSWGRSISVYVKSAREQ